LEPCCERAAYPNVGPENRQIPSETQKETHASQDDSNQRRQWVAER